LSPRERAVVVDVHRGRDAVTTSFLGCGVGVLPGESPRDVGASLHTRVRVLRRRRLFSNERTSSVGVRRTEELRHAVSRRAERVDHLLDVLTRERRHSRAFHRRHHVGLGLLERGARVGKLACRRVAVVGFSRVKSVAFVVDVVPPGSLGARLHAIARGGRGRHVGSTRLEARVPWFTAKRTRG
jgi:hypothetical protein